jgi:hypothetical protein
MLRQSLEALQARDPELVERICWPVESDHVVLDASGEVQYRLNQGRYVLSLSPESVERSLQGLPPGGEILVFGIGLGEQVDALLQLRPHASVVAWERDPWLLRLALGRYDWSAELASGRLRLVLGCDLVEELAASRAGSRGSVLLHPFLALVYQNERLLLDQGARGRRLAFLCAGGLFVDDMAKALAKAGFVTFTLDIHRLSHEELARAMERARPQLVASINYTEGLAELVAAAQRDGAPCPLICWEVDPATSALPPCRSSTRDTHVFTYREKNVAEYHAAGFENVEYLPLATNPERRRSVVLSDEDRLRYGAALSFVGSSMVPESEGFRQAFLAEYASRRPRTPQAGAEGMALLEQVLAEQRKDFSRYLVPAVLASAVSRVAPDLAARFPEALPRLARMAGEIAAAEKRVAYLSRLGPLGLRIWGDEGWRGCLLTGAQMAGPAGHGAELTKIYCASLINLDVSRLYQDDIVTMRVFDVLSCGGFILAEWSDALGELFEIGVEVECYRSLEELADKAAFYLAHPDRARVIAQRGQQAVRTRHTVQARVEHMLRRSGADRGQVTV